MTIERAAGVFDLIQEATNDVYVYEYWKDQYHRLFGKKYKYAALGAEDDGQGDNPRLNRGLAESEEHKALKRYVLDHPKLVLTRAKGFKGKPEVGLSSGDRLDVLFASDSSQVAVEVKSRRSNADDMRRGILQCIKYRAVLEAQCINLSIAVETLLVVEEALPTDLAALASQLKVRWKVIRVPG